MIKVSLFATTGIQARKFIQFLANAGELPVKHDNDLDLWLELWQKKVIEVSKNGIRYSVDISIEISRWFKNSEFFFIRTLALPMLLLSQCERGVIVRHLLESVQKGIVDAIMFIIGGRKVSLDAIFIQMEYCKGYASILMGQLIDRLLEESNHGKKIKSNQNEKEVIFN